MKIFIILSIFASVAILSVRATPAISSNINAINGINRSQLEEGFLLKLNTKCSQRDDYSCKMLKMIVFMNRVMKKPLLEINENIKVTENSNAAEITDDTDDPEDAVLLARSIDSDEETLGVLVANKIWKFIRSRSLRYKFSDNADFIVTTEPKGNLNFGVSISPIEAIEEGRGKMKNMGPLLMMMAAKTGMIGALMLKGLFLLAGKALIISKIALILAVIIALKKLLEKKKHIVEIPHHHDTYSAGWARALDGFIEGIAEVPAQIMQQEAQDMAYKAHKID